MLGVPLLPPNVRIDESNLSPSNLHRLRLRYRVAPGAPGNSAPKERSEVCAKEILVVDPWKPPDDPAGHQEYWQVGVGIYGQRYVVVNPVLPVPAPDVFERDRVERRDIPQLALALGVEDQELLDGIRRQITDSILRDTTTEQLKLFHVPEPTFDERRAALKGLDDQTR